jgi:hypothetical protein
MTAAAPVTDGRRDALRGVGLAGCAVLVGAVFDVSMGALGAPLAVGPAFPAAAGALFGPAGAAGVALGWALFALAGWTLGGVVLVPLAGGVGATLVGWALRPALAAGTRPRRFASAVGVAWVAGLVGLGAAGWVGVVAGVQPFATTLAADAPVYAAALVLAPAVLVAVSGLVPTGERAVAPVLGVGVVGAAWVVLGGVFSLGRLWAGGVPGAVVEKYLPPTVARAFVWGAQEQPVVVQAAVGLGFCAVLVALARRA